MRDLNKELELIKILMSSNIKKDDISKFMEYFEVCSINNEVDVNMNNINTDGISILPYATYPLPIKDQIGENILLKKIFVSLPENIFFNKVFLENGYRFILSDNRKYLKYPSFKIDIKFKEYWGYVIKPVYSNNNLIFIDVIFIKDEPNETCMKMKIMKGVSSGFYKIGFNNTQRGEYFPLKYTSKNKDYDIIKDDNTLIIKPHESNNSNIIGKVIRYSTKNNSKMYLNIKDVYEKNILDKKLKSGTFDIDIIYKRKEDIYYIYNI